MNILSRFPLALTGTVAGCLLPVAAASAAPNAPVKPNVLFIAVDDLRPALGCYGDPLAKTPNIDRLSNQGTTFLRAYCQQAVCSPSRTSIMTGLRPDTTRVYDLQTHFRKTIPNVVTMPQYFKANGYHTQSMGKMYHNGLDDEASWSVPSVMPKAPDYGPQGEALKERKIAATLEARKTTPGLRLPQGLTWESVDGVPDSYFRDGATADLAVQTLRERSQKAEPFFLAVGFSKPHLPFVAPKKYFDLFGATTFQLPANYRFTPRDAPPIALSNWGEMRNYHDMPKAGPNAQPVTDAQALELIRAYYASASYMDAQLGRVLSELDRLKLRDNTVIVLWGDHGYQLGDHTMWAKHTNYETSVRVPLIVSLPKQRAAKARQLAELVDVFPTLCEAAGLPIPQNLAGESLLPIVRDVNAKGQSAAFSQYPRGPQDAVMGYSIRTDRYRFTEWITKADGSRQAVELYDHQLDPDENQNIAARPEHKALIDELSRQLGMTRAVTPSPKIFAAAP